MKAVLGALERLAQAVADVYEATRSDDKTTLQNAIALNEAARRFGSDPTTPEVVVFADLNRFKAVNDQWGHAAGDATLHQVGELIRAVIVGGCDARAFRKSGDEFVILLKQTMLPVFYSKLETFRECTTPFDGNVTTVSVSFGLCAPDGEPADFQVLLDRAERACLLAKAQGGGKCVVWDPAIEAAGIITLRTRCPGCNSTVSADIPSGSVPASGLLALCPVCGTSLDCEGAC